MLATLDSAHAAVIIGQAKGILMAQGDLDSDDAFDQLRTASQRLNMKLRDLAADVVSRRRQGSGRPSSASPAGLTPAPAAGLRPARAGAGR